MIGRVRVFMAVGALGFAVQISALAFLTRAGWPLVAATAAAVELAILHNFCWHECWTWRDRTSALRRAGRFARFHAATGAASIGVNVVLTTALVELFRLPPVMANTLAVAMASAVNFSLADKWVFVNRTALAFAAASVLAPMPASAEPPGETLDAWNVYVARAESRIPGEEPTPCTPDGRPQGEALSVPGGTIHRWRGCTLVRATSVAAVVDALMHPGTPPPQEDVIDSRVLSRSGDSLHVYLRIVRRTILTVTYDTEHDVSFDRQRPDFATSRSVATRIVESESGGDRGFLWKLNSYWRYIQANEGVRIELDSISLSRDVPMLLRPVAAPIIARVARESITRALEAVRTYCDRGDLAIKPRAGTH